jgi:hypothetical protein
MPVRRNDGDSYPGAEVEFVPPVTPADCCLFQTVQEMMVHAAEEGWAATIKGGRAFVDASLEDVHGVCFIGEPNVQSVNPDPIEETASWAVGGLNFGEGEGEVWLTDAPTWGGSVVKVQQTVTTWTESTVSMGIPVLDGLPYSPGHVYVFVVNECGERNAEGYETEVVEGPP